MHTRHAKFWLKQVAAVAAILLLLLALAPLAEACPQCQKALAGSNGGVGGRIVQGYMWSILFMLAMPFVLLGSMSTYFYLLVRRARREQAAAQLATV